MQLTKLASIHLIYWNILKKYRINPDEVFAAAGLNPALMQEPGARYDLGNSALLWEEMGRRINDPCFGLTAASCWHPSHFGTLGYAMLVSKNLRICLERLLRFHKVVSDARFGRLDEDAQKKALVFTILYEDEAPYPQPREDAVLAWIMSSLRINFQQELTPVSVSFTHARPDCAGKYFEFFQAPVVFDAKYSSLALPLDVVDLPLPSGNDELAAFSDQAMERYIAGLDESTLSVRVKQAIVDHLPSGDADVNNIASELHLNKRTLQRLLQKEGTTFIALLNETRESIAKQYVRDKNMDLNEIAYLLGFAELSTFSRSFKRWTGASPMQFRKTV